MRGDHINSLILLLVTNHFLCSGELFNPQPCVVAFPLAAKKPRDIFTDRCISEMRDCMRGKTVLVTGSNAGIGFETARLLAGQAGATTILACRNAAAAASAATRIRAEFADASVECVHLDLEDLGSIDRLAEALSRRPVHMLIHNAGIMAAPSRRTADGFESTFQVGHWMLVPLAHPNADRLHS